VEAEAEVVMEEEGTTAALGVVGKLGEFLVGVV
jgi:hypothetical protein